MRRYAKAYMRQSLHAFLRLHIYAFTLFTVHYLIAHCFFAISHQLSAILNSLLIACQNPGGGGMIMTDLAPTHTCLFPVTIPYAIVA